LFFDADVLIAGAASASGASHLLLRLSELDILEGLTTRLALAEAERNVAAKLPHAILVLRALVQEAIEVMENPSSRVCAPWSTQADVEDVPHLTAAVREGCQFLVTFNTRHYWPETEDIEVIRPGDLLRRVRLQIASLEPSSGSEGTEVAESG
jgi:hypothetical protein